MQTRRQKEVLDAMAAFSTAHGRAPTIGELAAALGVPRQAVSAILLRMRKAELVEYDGRKGGPKPKRLNDWSEAQYSQDKPFYMSEAVRAFWQAHGRAPTYRELANEIGCSHVKVFEHVQFYRAKNRYWARMVGCR